MTVSIPASAIVNVIPNVINAGGSGLDLSGIFLTSNSRVPIGTIAAFASAAAVSEFFGSGATETLVANRYFGGFDGSTIKPARILFYQYPSVDVPAYLRGGSVAALTIAELQDTPVGTITLTIDGVAVTSGAIDVSAAASFSAAAAVIETALNYADAVVTGAIAATTLTVSAVTSGTLAVGQVIEGTGITAGTKITALGTGTGGTGTYTVTPSQTAASTSIRAGEATVAYDPTSGGFVITAGTPGADGDITVANSGATANALKLSASTGAITSQGGDAGVPATAMDDVIANTQNFATFATVDKPSVDDMVAFGAWANDQGARYAYIMWDNNVAATQSPDTTSAGAQIIAAEYGSTVPIYAPVDGLALAAFVMGGIASIDFARVNGRTNMAFRSSDALTAGVTNATIAENLIANGYNFYGAYATAADEFIFFYPGQVTGPFAWIDTLVNEIWMTNNFQLALMNLLTAIPSIPYNDVGYQLIETSLTDPIDVALAFGAIRPGVPLSALQRTQVNTMAGAEVAPVIEQRGWYLQVQPATPEVRAARGSPPITFWYTDGQSVQKIVLNSVEIA